MPGPITPDQAKALKITIIPEFVYEAINLLLTERATHGTITIKQGEIVDAICKVSHGPKSDIFTKNWLDFEDAYRRAGWDVVYDKPGWDETYESFWRFSRKRTET